MFSQTLEYALRAVVCVAQADGKAMTGRQIAAMTRVPANYLSKVLQTLVKVDLIQATRGVGGGYVLAHPASEITILQIVSAIDPLKRIRSCPLGLASHGGNLCPLHHRMDQVLDNAEAVFRKTTIAELLSDHRRSTPLCEVRRAAVRK